MTLAKGSGAVSPNKIQDATKENKVVLNSNTDQIEFSTANTLQAVLNSSGTLTLGTSLGAEGIEVIRSSASTDFGLKLKNNSNGDIKVTLETAAQSYSLGIDNSVNDWLKLSTSSTDVGASTLWTIKPDGKLGLLTTPTSTLHVGGSIAQTITTITSTTTLNDTHSLVHADATSGTVNISLPTSVGIAGRSYIVMKIDSSANTVVIDANASETISGDLTLTLTGQYDWVTLRSDGANWITEGSNNLEMASICLDSGTLSALPLNFCTDTNTGLYNPAADNLAFVTGGTARLTIKEDQVGIGTTTPQANYKLDVNGAFNAVSSNTSYVDDGVFGATALPSKITYPNGMELRFGYTSNGSGDYFPRIGTLVGTAKTSFGSAQSDGNAFTINTGISDVERVRIDSTGLELNSGLTYQIFGSDVLSATTLGSGVVNSSLTSVGTIISGTWSGSFGAVSGANLTSLTAGNLTGTIPSAVLGNSTVYVGTTAVLLNRSSGSLALTGITSIDGSAASASKSTNLVGGNNTTLLGSVPYQSNTDTTTLLSPNVSTTKNFLSQTGTGTNGAAPVWSTVTKSDVGLGNVENTALSTWAGSSNITTVGTLTSLTVSGDLTVNGTTTTINSTTLTVDDKNIELGSVSVPTDVTADGGGITLKGTTDKTINWTNATGDFDVSENWDLASGKVYKINNTSVLSGTTLGSGVVNSSLTSVGTLTGLTVSGIGSPVLLVQKNTDGYFATFRGTSNAQLQIGVFSGVLTLDSSNGAAEHAFSTNSVERMRINSTGNVGIGAINPLGKLHVKQGVSGVSSISSNANTLVLEGSTAQGITFASPNTSFSTIAFADPENNAAGQIEFNHPDDNMSFKINGISKINISPSSVNFNAIATINTTFQSLTSGTSTLSLASTDTAAINKGGTIQFVGAYNGSTQTIFAQIAGLKENGTSGNYDGYLGFYTRKNGDGVGVERMRLDSAGNLGIGITSSLGKVHIKQGTSGVSSVSVNSDGLVIEDAVSTGISICTPNTSVGNIFFTDPDAAAPGYIQYNHSTNNMVFGTSSSNRLRIDSSGNTGFGVVPSYKIHSQVTGADNTTYIETVTSGNPILSLSAAGQGGTQLYHNRSTGSFIIRAEGGADRVTLSSGGDLGIGVTPSSKLHVNGSARFDNATFFYHTNNTTRMGYIANQFIAQGSGDTADLYLVADTNMRFGAGGANEMMRLTSTGLGIGTTNPGTKLEVAGTLTVTGAGINLDNGQNLVGKNSSGTYRNMVAISAANNLELGSTVDGGIKFFSSLGNERMMLSTTGQFTIRDGTLFQYSPDPTAKAAAATLTAAELFTSIIETSGTSYTLTLPTGTSIDGGVTNPVSSTGFEFTIINSASGTITLAVNTGVTSSGDLTVLTGTSAHFRLRRTAANTYVVYRLN